MSGLYKKTDTIYLNFIGSGVKLDNSSIYQIQNPRWSLHNRFKTWDPKKKILRNFKHEPTLLNRRMVPYEVEIKMVTTAGQSLTCEEKSYF
jgi:hypothetical protein